MSKTTYLNLLAPLVATVSLWAQTPPAAAPTQAPGSNPAPAGGSSESGGKALRWVQFGVAVSYFPISYLENKTRDTTLSDTTTFSSQNESLAGRAGLSPEVHFHFASRWGAATGVHFRGGDFRLTNTTTVTTTSGSTTTTKTSSTKERTSFRSFEIPVLARRYNILHSESGFRWFYQGGLSMRHVYGIRSERSSTATDGKVTCCDETAARPQNVNTFGITAGAGFTSRDQFGIRVTPEVRYTRWMGGAWGNQAARTSRGQVELMVGFQF